MRMESYCSSIIAVGLSASSLLTEFMIVQPTVGMGAPDM